MADKNRQHYVPKFYLRNFSNNTKAIDTFNFTNSKYIQNSSIKDMCQRHNFYGADNKLENFLAEVVESKASLLIKNILETNKFPKEIEDYIDLYQFLLISEARNLKIAESVNNSVNFIARSILEQNPDFKDSDLDTYKMVLNEPSRIAIETAIECTKLILDLKPLLIIEKTGSSRSLITSDNPLIRYNYFYLYNKYHGSYGYMDRGAQFFFPISSSKCILLYDSLVYNVPNQQENIIYLNRARDVDQLNELFFLNAHNNVFFNQKVKKDYIVKLHNKYKQEPRIGDLSRETQKFSSVDSQGGGKLLRVSHNRVRKKFNFPWLKLTKFADNLVLPAHMGGIPRINSPFITEKIDQLKQEFDKEHPPFTNKLFRS